MIKKMNQTTPAFFVLLLAFLCACSKPDLALDRANAILASMTCTKSGTAEWRAAMASDRERGQNFIADYKRGMHSFKIPIDEVLENTKEMFDIACNGPKMSR